MKRNVRWWIIGLVAIVMIVVTAVAFGSKKQSAAVQPGTIKSRVIARAVVTSEDGIAEVRSRVEGRVLRVAVREGDIVREGDLLAEIESADLQAQLRRLEAEKAVAMASEKSVAEGAREEERTAAEAEVRAAESDFAIAKDNTERLSKLHAVGGTTDAEMDRARKVEGIAKARLDAAQAKLRLTRSGGRWSDVSAMKARVLAADEAVSQARAGLDYSKIIAPIGGTVLARRVDPGDTITTMTQSTSAPLFEIANADHLEVRAEVEELDAMDIQSGMTAHMTLPGGGNPIAEGIVKRLGAKLERRSIGIEDARARADSTVRSVWISFKEQGKYPIGQRLEVVFELQPKTVQAMVPRNAITIVNAEATVQVKSFLFAKNIPVKMGIADTQHVELFGVPIGTEVILH